MRSRTLARDPRFEICLLAASRHHVAKELAQGLRRDRVAIGQIAHLPTFEIDLEAIAACR